MIERQLQFGQPQHGPAPGRSSTNNPDWPTHPSAAAVAMSKHGAGGQDAGRAARLWAFGAAAPCRSPIARSAWPWLCCVCCAARPTCWCSGNCGDGALPATWCSKRPERLPMEAGSRLWSQGAGGLSPGLAAGCDRSFAGRPSRNWQAPAGAPPSDRNHASSARTSPDR